MCLDLKNYRPVSDLSFLSKVIEKMVVRQFFTYLKSLCPSQSAYRPCHSTETALPKMTNDILFALDGSDVSVLFLLDLSSAFDTIDTMFPSTDFNLSMAFLSWFFRGLSLTSLVGLRLWLSMTGIEDTRTFSLGFHRAQFLVLSSSFSTLHLSALWLKLIMSPCNQSFADDTQLHQFWPYDQIHATILTMQTFISDVETWMTQNKLKLYDDKTEALLMKSNRTIFHYTQPTSLRADTADVPFTTCAGNLGF